MPICLTEIMVSVRSSLFYDRLGYTSLLKWNSCLISALYSHTSAVSMEVHYMFLTPSVAFCAFNPVYLLFLEIVLICHRIYDFDFGKCWKLLYEGIYLFLILFVTSFIMFYEGIVGDLTWVMLPKENWLNRSQERKGPNINYLTCWNNSDK